MSVIGYLIGAAAAIVIPSIFLYLAFRSLLSDVWKLLFLGDLQSRKIPTLVFGLLWSLPLAWGTLALFGIARIEAALFVIVAIVPALTCFSLNRWAWWRDDRETRDAALEIAVERAARSGESAPLADAKSPWADYVFDAEVARRRALYEPPPI